MAGEQLFSKPLLGARLNMAHPLADGLVGCWLLNEQMGLRAMDLSPYGNHGLLSGFPANYQRSFNGLPFDGVNDYIDCGNSTILKPTGGVTWEAWGEFGILGVWKAIIGTKETVTFHTRLQRAADNSLNWSNIMIAGTSREISTTGFSTIANTWYHIVATFNGTTRSLYINGLLNNSISTDIGAISWMENVYIGVSGASLSNPLLGSIGLARIWKRALTADEVKALYLSPYAPMGLKMFF